MKDSENSSDHFCYFPFYQLLLQPTGNISPCCWNEEYVLGNIKDRSLTEIWNDQPIRKLRREFLDSKPEICASKIQEIQCHKRSIRHFSKKIQLTEFQKEAPKRFDVRLNGKCNLQCVMCDVWKEPNGIYNNSEFWSKGKNSFFPNILEIDVLGGEPFIQSDTYRLIQEISEVNAHCLWAFVTNGQYHLNHFILKKLENLELRWIQISLDSVISKTYAKIRYPGKLDRALATLDRLQKYQQTRIHSHRGFEIRVSMCVQQENWSEIDTFLDYTKSRGFTPSLQFLYTPLRLSLLSLSVDEKKYILESLLELLFKYNPTILRPILEPLRQDLTRNLRSPVSARNAPKTAEVLAKEVVLQLS